VYIDEEGRPYNAEVQQCPKVFEDNAREGVLKWSWWPYKVDGKKVKVQTTIAFMYRM
jgi:outer membrane biosynthesis protein TonB